MVVAGGGDHGPQQGAIHVHAADHRSAEHQKLQVFMGRLARIEQVPLGGVADRPVDVLTRTVDAGEGLLVQQAGQAMLLRRAAQQGHGELLVVGGHVGGLEERRNLKLGWGHLVVAGFGRNPQAVHLPLHLLHEDLHPLGDGAEVVVVKLLALGGGATEQGAAGQQQVWSQGHVGAVDQEVLLLGAAAGVDRGNGGFPQQAEQLVGLFVYRCDRAQQGGFFVEGFAGPRDEDGGYAEGDTVGRLHQPGRAGDVPGGVAASFKGGADTAIGKGGAVGLALHQHLAGEFGEDRAVALG